MRSLVYRLVKKIADKKAVDALIPILRENEDAARFYEPLTSWIIGSPQSVEVLAYASNDKDYFVRYMAAKALVNIGSAPAINALINALENKIPGLFICGAYQFLGKFYKAADGTMIKGLSFFDLYTENPGLNYKRLIGNVIIETKLFKTNIVGFENHGGRTYLNNRDQAFATVIKGFGNNGEDKTEGIIYKNSIGTYLHGPILPKNPELADYIIKKALEAKYKEEINLAPLDDSLELKARQFIAKKYL